jgi:hypothetical protein
MTFVKIAMLGTGKVGSALGMRWSQKGHEIIFGSRNPQGEKTLALVKKFGAGTRAATIDKAATEADLVVLATPWIQAQSVLKAAGDLTGKIVIDCVNPLNADFSGLDLGHTTSASERIATWIPAARVVKAFNTVSAAAMLNPIFDGQKATLFICGDDPQAKSVVLDLAEQLDFEAVDAGPLQIARYLEPLAMLYIQLAIQEGWGSNYAFKIMRR